MMKQLWRWHANHASSGVQLKAQEDWLLLRQQPALLLADEQA
jgi:hypothetical protein